MANASNLVSLVLLDLLPQLGVLLNADLLLGVELVEAAEVHVLGEERDDVLVERLPVWVLKVVPALGQKELQWGKHLRENDKRWIVGGLLLAALVFVALDDGEGAGVLVVLHHEPFFSAIVSFEDS